MNSSTAVLSILHIQTHYELSHIKFKKQWNFTCEQPQCVLSLFALCEVICAHLMRCKVSAWLTRASSLAQELTAACTVSWSFSLHSPIKCSYLTPPYPYITRAATLWHQSVFCLLTWLWPQGKSCTWVYDTVSGRLEMPSALKSWLRVQFYWELSVTFCVLAKPLGEIMETKIWFCLFK